MDSMEVEHDRTRGAASNGISTRLQRLGNLWHLFGPEAVVVFLALLELTFLAFSVAETGSIAKNFDLSDYEFDNDSMSNLPDMTLACREAVSDLDEPFFVSGQAFSAISYCDLVASPGKCPRKGIGEVDGWTTEICVSATIERVIQEGLAPAVEAHLSAINQDLTPALSAFLFLAVYKWRMCLEILAIVLAFVCQKFKNLELTPLAFDWQPGNVLDSILLVVGVLSAGVNLITRAVDFPQDFTMAADFAGNANATVGGGQIYETPVEVQVAVTVVTQNSRFYVCAAGIFLCCVAVMSIISFASFLFLMREIPFIGASRAFALGWEAFGMSVDVAFLILVSSKIEKSGYSPSMLLAVEVVRCSMELIQDFRGMKLTYVGGSLFIPVSALDKIKKLNTTRQEAIKSVTLDSVTIVTKRTCTSKELGSEIVQVTEALRDGPIGGGEWCTELGENARECSYKASLAIQPVSDSELAWVTDGKVVVRFTERGVTLEAVEGGRRCQQSTARRVQNKATRIETTEVWS